MDGYDNSAIEAAHERMTEATERFRQAFNENARRMDLNEDPSAFDAFKAARDQFHASVLGYHQAGRDTFGEIALILDGLGPTDDDGRLWLLDYAPPALDVYPALMPWPFQGESSGVRLALDPDRIRLLTVTTHWFGIDFPSGHASYWTPDFERVEVRIGGQHGQQLLADINDFASRVASIEQALTSTSQPHPTGINAHVASLAVALGLGQVVPKSMVDGRTVWNPDGADLAGDEPGAAIAHLEFNPDDPQENGAEMDSAEINHAVPVIRATAIAFHEGDTSALLELAQFPPEPAPGRASFAHAALVTLSIVDSAFRSAATKADAAHARSRVSDAELRRVASAILTRSEGSGASGSMRELVERYGYEMLPGAVAALEAVTANIARRRGEPFESVLDELIGTRGE